MNIFNLKHFAMLLAGAVLASCHSKVDVNITPHPVNPVSDRYYQQAVSLMAASYDVDSAKKCLSLLNKALAIDSLNPDYYGVKAKLFSELGELDSALHVQTVAFERNAVTGEYLFQLGLFQAARDLNEQAHESFRRSNVFLKAVLKQYPDSLGAFFLQQAAHSLYQGEDSLFMRDIDNIRKRFPNRLMEIEMTRRLKPHALIKQIKKIQHEKENMPGFDLDSLMREVEKRQR